MGTGGRVVLQRGHGGRRRRKMDGEDDDDGDEEYVVSEDEEEVEEDEEYVSAACSDENGEEEAGPEPEPEDESDADFDGEEEELEDLEEDEELEIDTPRPKRPAKARGRGRKAKPSGSRRRRLEDDDDYQEEIEEEDEDFDPDVDEEEEEEVEDDDGDFAPIRAKKVRPKNHVAKRKPATGRRHRKRRRKSGSRVSKGKARKGTPARRRRKRLMVDDYEDEDEDFIVKDDQEELNLRPRKKRWVVGDCEDDEEEEDEDEDFIVKDDQEEDEEEEEDEDEDFIVKDDQEEVNHRPRKKAKVGRNTRDGTPEPVVDGETWPSVESDTSEFEFVTSDEEPAEIEAPTAEPARNKGKKTRRKRGSGSESSSDSDYVISEEELKDLVVPKPPETAPQPHAPPPRRIILLRRVEKGKEPEEALKQICGICLTEEQRATIQGVLNCCSHYFCFACILEWSTVESRCPLCKRRFNTITKSSEVDMGLGLRKAVVKVAKRDQVYQPTEEEMRSWLDPYENVVCIECNQGGDDNLMLLCDICDSSAHTYCVGLGREVPGGNWYCGGCRSGVEGPSYAQAQDRVVNHGESNTISNTNSGSVGTAISGGVFQRPPPINIQPSLQGFDLNLSPTETPDEDKRADSRISANPVSTPTGRHATLSRRRFLNRRIRILLFRPSIANAWQNGGQCDRTISDSEQNQRSARASTEANPSCSRGDFMQNQQSSSSSFQSVSHYCGGGSDFREIEGAKDQLIPIVKKSLKRICAQSPLDQSAFKTVARRATHTILALSGITHNRDMVVATPYPFPSNCYHPCDGREPAFLMRTCCSSCFNSFVADVICDIANMFS